MSKQQSVGKLDVTHPERDVAHHIQAINVARGFWYCFLRVTLTPGESPFKLDHLRTGQIAQKLFEDTMSSGNPTHNDILTQFIAFAAAYLKEYPPEIIYHPLSIAHIKGTAKEKHDQIAADGPTKPASWLYAQSDDGKEHWPVIIVDRKYIQDWLSGKAKDSSPAAVMGRIHPTIRRLILKEFFHFIMHWKELYDHPAQPENASDQQFRLGVETAWANLDQEEQAWIASQTIIGLALAEIALEVRKVAGEFDSAWKCL